jgi:hypothetical protein
MSTTMNSIDRVLGVLNTASGPDAKGQYVAFCPAHDDHNTPNLHLREAEDGKVLVHCFAGCSQDRVLAALEERGLRKSDLFADHNEGRGGHIHSSNAALPQRSSGTRTGHAEDAGAAGGAALDQPPTQEGCTLEAYAGAKRLPVEFLRSLRLETIHYNNHKAVRMPYLDAEGSAEVCVRFRISLDGKPKVKTRKGDKHHLYGLWRLDEAREAGFVVLVEGESDCHTLWHHGFAAVGIPGSRSWRDCWAAELKSIPRVYVVVEPDHGGEDFWRRLASSPLRERLYRVELEVPDDQD